MGRGWPVYVSTRPTQRKRCLCSSASSWASRGARLLGGALHNRGRGRLFPFWGRRLVGRPRAGSGGTRCAGSSGAGVLSLNSLSEGVMAVSTRRATRLIWVPLLLVAVLGLL